MVLKEWGEIRELDNACWKRVHRAVLAPNKFRHYWYVWVTTGLFLLASYVYTFPTGIFGYTWMGLFLSTGAILLTAWLMFVAKGKAIATEFKDEYVDHGIKRFPRWRRQRYLQYALFLRGLAERGYTREKVRKLKDFGPGGRLRRERGGAGVAVPALHDRVAVVALPCPHNLRAVAVDAALKVCANELRSERSVER